MVFVYVMSLRVNRRALEHLWEGLSAGHSNSYGRGLSAGALEQLWERGLYLLSDSPLLGVEVVGS